MTRDPQIVSIKLPLADVLRIPGNRSEFVRQAVAEKLARESAPLAISMSLLTELAGRALVHNSRSFV
jgi:hypothetical protein